MERVALVPNMTVFKKTLCWAFAWTSNVRLPAVHFGAYLRSLDAEGGHVMSHKRCPVHNHGADIPTTDFVCRGSFFVFKPSNWEMCESNQGGAYLVFWSSLHHAVQKWPLSFAFVTRLDCPSSCIIVVVTCIHAADALGLQISTYQMCRCYITAVGNL